MLLDADNQQDQVSEERTFKQVAEHKLPTAVLGVAAHRDNKRLYAACLNGVYSVDSDSGEFERLYQHASYVSGVAMTAEDSVLISAGYDGVLQWHNLQKNAPIRSVEAHKFWSWDLAISADRTRVASATGQYLVGGYKYEPAAESEPSVKVFAATSGELLQAFSYTPPVQAVALSPDGRHVAAGNLTGEVRVWDIDTGQLAAQWTTSDLTSWGIIKSHCYIGGIFALRFTPDGNEVLVAGMGPMRDPMAGNGQQIWQRFAWKNQPPQKTAEIAADQAGKGLMEALAVDPQGRFFLMAGRVVSGDWNCAAFDLAQGNLLQGLKPLPRVTDMAVSTDGHRVYVSGAHGQAHKPKDGKYPEFGQIVVYEIA